MIKKTEIIIFTKDKDIAYSPCAIPLVLGGCIKSFEDIIMHDSKYYQNKNIQIHLSTTVTNIDSSNKKITFKKDKNTKTIPYDKLVLATGSKIITPEFDIDNTNNIFSLTKISMTEEIFKNQLTIKKTLYLSQIYR